MKTAFSFAWVFFLSGFLWAQPEWRVEGFVKSETGEHLPGARLQVADTIVAISDARGFYRAVLPLQPESLTAVYLGFYPKSEIIRADGINTQPMRLDFVLVPQNTTLPEVSIGAKRAEIIATEDFQTDILDFDLIGEKVLVLVRQRKKYLARLLDPAQRLLAEIELAGQPKVLHRSCTGVFHLTGLYFAQELIILQDDKLDTFPRYAAADFHKLIEPCVLEHQGYYFFRKRGAFNQSVNYWYVDPEKQRRPLIEIHNEAGRKEAGYAVGALLSGAPVVAGPTNLPPNWQGQPYDEGFNNTKDIYRGDFSLEHLVTMANTNAQIAQLGWIESLRLDSIYTPLLRMTGDTLTLFDHEHDVALRFHPNSARHFQQIPILYHHGKGWQKKLLYDPVRGDLYAQFAPGGQHLLRRLDPHNFEPLTDYRLPEVGFFPSQLKVRDGFAYFLSRPSPNDVNARLYKVNIRQNKTP